MYFVSKYCKCAHNKKLFIDILKHHQLHNGEGAGWPGGAMVLGKLTVPGPPTIWIKVGQWPIALAVGAGGVVWTCLLTCLCSPLSC